MTWDERQAIVATRTDACQCCGKVPTNKYGTCLDHDHGTGDFRGWLCHQCNTGIGSLGDDLDGLRRAIAYLEGAPHISPVIPHK
jgi:hypothetical protein